MKSLGELSDQAIERLLSGQVPGEDRTDVEVEDITLYVERLRGEYLQTPGANVESRHIAAMTEASQPASEKSSPAVPLLAASKGPESKTRRMSSISRSKNMFETFFGSLAAKAAAIAMAAVTATGGLVATGAFGPASQDKLAGIAGKAGISLPNSDSSVQVDGGVQAPLDVESIAMPDVMSSVAKIKTLAGDATARVQGGVDAVTSCASQVDAKVDATMSASATTRSLEVAQGLSAQAVDIPAYADRCFEEARGIIDEGLAMAQKALSLTGGLPGPEALDAVTKAAVLEASANAEASVQTATDAIATVLHASGEAAEKATAALDSVKTALEGILGTVSQATGIVSGVTDLASSATAGIQGSVAGTQVGTDVVGKVLGS